MNIFIMILVVLFMTGYYIIDSPSQKIQEHETDYAVEQSDMRSVAQCAAAVHNAQIKGYAFDDICIQQNNIVSQYVCLDKNLKTTQCDTQNNKKPAFNYIVTATGVLPQDQYHKIMNILESEYSDAGTFGIMDNNTIVSGGTTNRRIVPKTIIDTMKLESGQLVYLTQYKVPENANLTTLNTVEDIVCPVGTVKVYRFGRWQCTYSNTKITCGGDKIWDSDLQECVPDESRKPLCANNQSAVMIDDVWECISPFPEKSCPGNMVAQLNYNTLEWECVEDPNNIKETTKCEHIKHSAVYGTVGTTLRVPNTSCTDCEKLVVDMETCAAQCVPDPTKLNSPECYPGPLAECTGPNRAFYFGFPNVQYSANVSDVAGLVIPVGSGYSQNRRFNCMDCGDGVIDTEKSKPPYVAICK